jgi:hypothetical protein
MITTEDNNWLYGPGALGHLVGQIEHAERIALVAIPRGLNFVWHALPTYDWIMGEVPAKQTK